MPHDQTGFQTEDFSGLNSPFSSVVPTTSGAGDLDAAPRAGAFPSRITRPLSTALPVFAPESRGDKQCSREKLVAPSRGRSDRRGNGVATLRLERCFHFARQSAQLYRPKLSLLSRQDARALPDAELLRYLDLGPRDRYVRGRHRLKRFRIDHLSETASYPATWA